MSNKRGCPKCTISEFFVKVLGDDGKPKFWNSLDKEMAYTFCLKKNDNSFENLEQGKGIVIELQDKTDIGNTSENPVLSKCLKSNHNEERLENGISKYLLKSSTDKWIKEFQLKSIAIPSCQTLGGKLLNNAANKLQTKTLKTIQNAKAIMLTFDGWKNVAKQNILGITCITEEDEVIIYDARDISSEHSTMEATIKLVKDLLIEDILKDFNIIAIVTDFSSGYAAACHKLRKELLTIIWLPCFAHQANLCIADIFKLSQSFFSAIKQAVVVTTFFNKSLFFTILLKNICNDFKIPYFALTNPCKTRWYSYFNCIRALLKVERALRSLSVTHEASIRIYDKKALALSQSVTINSASVKRLFSDMGFIHSKHRVHFNEKKVMKIAQLRANQHKENTKKLDIKKLNSMQVHTQNNNSMSIMNTNNEVSVNVESNTNQMIKETDSSDEEEEYKLILDELDYNSEILHPAKDPQAKWDLNALFSSSSLLNLA
ncbi:21272_t:CDS:2, partial [Gigaspora margarita]